jgi:integrase
MIIPVVTPVINWRGKINKKGTYPIHLRVYINPEPYRYYPIKIPLKIRLDQWSGRDGIWLKDNHPFAFEINTKIAEIKSKITELTKRFYMQNKSINFYIIDREILRKGDRTIFNDYFKNYIERPPATVNLDDITWEKYRACLLHLNNFQSKISFAEIDETLIARFKNYLAGLKGQKGKMVPATIKSYFDKLRVVLNHAAKKDRFLDPQDIENYFDEIKITVPTKREGQHLEIEEIQKLRALKFEKKDKSLERDRDVFLFQIYTGFYYNDLQILRKDQLHNDIEYGNYIISERDKNGRPTIIPLFKFPYATAIINRYNDNVPDNNYLFQKNTFIEIQVYNRNLKLLAKRANIARPLSNKTGRHTNAQMWIRFGAERPILSKMMGHEKEQTTQNYYKVGLREVIEGTKGVDFSKLFI